MHLRNSLSIVTGVFILLISGCNSGPRGVYSDANGTVILELRSGGKANITFMGDVQDCSFKSAGKELTLSCKGEAGSTVFAIHDDGSLSGPAGSFMPLLRKQK